MRVHVCVCVQERQRGFIINRGRVKFCGNLNKTLTKSILKITSTNHHLADQNPLWLAKFNIHFNGTVISNQQNI